ncbi:MAG: hypothetical protein AB7K08_04790 [Microbacteriaceae bacterium]
MTAISPAPAGPRKLLIALIVTGATLLLTIVAIAALIVGQATASAAPISSEDQAPSAEQPQTPAETPAEPAGVPVQQQPVSNGGGAPAPAPAPATDTSLRFVSFGADLNVYCDPNADEKAQPQISWSAANATAVYWTPSNQDATADNGYQVGTSGNQNDMSASKGPGERYEFPCNHRQTFDTTITIYGSNGQKVSKHVTFTDRNWGVDLGGDDDE